MCLRYAEGLCLKLEVKVMKVKDVMTADPACCLSETALHGDIEMGHTGQTGTAREA